MCSVAWHPFGAKVVADCYDGCVCIVDAASGVVEQEVERGGPMAWSPSGAKVATGSTDGGTGKAGEEARTQAQLGSFDAKAARGFVAAAGIVAVIVAWPVPY